VTPASRKLLCNVAVNCVHLACRLISRRLVNRYSLVAGPEHFVDSLRKARVPEE
jgi:hypothetical protein